jgi:hypothetical protein
MERDPPGIGSATIIAAAEGVEAKAILAAQQRPLQIFAQA